MHAYFAGNASEEDEQAIMDWAEHSPENYRSYLEERKRWDALLVNYNWDRAPRADTKKRTTLLRVFATVAAAASIALLFALFQWNRPAGQAEEKWQSIWVPPGQRAQVALDDGTTVWLNSRSTLTFPTSFVAGRRIVKLDGEGYFDVRKDAEHPFIVQTRKYNVEVSGTSFNVLAYDNYEVFETSLISGSVRVSPVRSERPGVLLKPNEKVYEAGGRLRVQPIDHPDYFRWKEGLICLDDERFEDLINKFALYFDMKIIIRNPKLLDYRCTGKFRQSDGVDYALKVLQKEMKFSYTRDNELNEITIR